jgi:hypothetical protein
MSSNSSEENVMSGCPIGKSEQAKAQKTVEAEKAQESIGPLIG